MGSVTARAGLLVVLVGCGSPTTCEVDLEATSVCIDGVDAEECGDQGATFAEDGDCRDLGYTFECDLGHWVFTKTDCAAPSAVWW